MTWLVWRPGSIEPSRRSPAIHFDDPAKDRSRDDHLAVIPIQQEHRGLPLRELLEIDRYKLPASAEAPPMRGPIMVLASASGTAMLA